MRSAHAMQRMLLGIVLLATSQASVHIANSRFLELATVALLCRSIRTSRPAEQLDQATVAVDGWATAADNSAHQQHAPPRNDRLAQIANAMKREDSLYQQHAIHSQEAEAQWRASATLGLLKALRTCYRCRSYIRYGADNDGGYIMCQEALHGVRAAYSFGIGTDDDWGKDVAQRLGVPVFEFDCFKEQAPSCEDVEKCDLRFRQECLGVTPWSNDTRTYRTLDEHLLRNPPPGHNPLHPVTKGGDLLIKVDVEGKEWNTFADARRQDLKRMRQVIVEFHMLSRVDFHEYYLKAFRKLLKNGFVVAHIHGNNFAPVAVFADGQYQVPDVVEVTFVNKLALPEGAVIDCATQQEVLTLDAPNNAWYLDLPQASLPKDDAELSMGNSRLTTVPVMRCRFFCSLIAICMSAGPAFWAAIPLIFGVLICMIATMVGPEKKQKQRLTTKG